MRKRVSICCIVCMLMTIGLTCTACWDRVEIDRRAFVSTVALDVGSDMEKYEEKKIEEKIETNGKGNLEVLQVTFGYPDISSLSQDFGSRVEEKKISTPASSVEEAISKVTSRSSRNIYMDHSKMMIISNELLEHPDVLKQAIDYFRRNSNFNRQTQIIVVDGKASAFESFKPDMENNFQTYMTGILENSNRNEGVIPLTLSNLLSLSSENRDVLVPYVKFLKNKSEVKLDGVAIIRDYKIIGMLDNDETCNVELLKGRASTGRKTVFINNIPIDYVVENSKRKISMESYEKGVLTIDIHVELEGAITEVSVDTGELSSNLVKSYEKKFNSSFEKESNEVIKKLCGEYGVDILGIKQYMEKFHPRNFRNMENQWDDILRNCKVKVTFDTNIRRIGIMQ